jgi:PAS domain S-box-containing protein
MITLYEPDAKLLNINREFTRVTGWAPEDIRGVSLMEEFYPDPAYRAEVEAFMNACKDGWMDIKMRRRDGALIDTTWANIALADGRRVGIGADIGERKRSERQRLSLINELNHRVKNTLATVQSIAMQTMRGAADSQEAFLRFETRLVALARAHDVLTKENWEGADLRSVVERVLEPFRAERDRFTVRGDSVRLAPRHALALAMAFHELATNAVKYGSLSADGGEVEVEWSALAARSAVALVWREKNGPPVRGPVRKGFGSRLLEKSLAHDLGAAAEIEFRASGVVVKLTAPYENMWR